METSHQVSVVALIILGRIDIKQFASLTLFGHARSVLPFLGTVSPSFISDFSLALPAEHVMFVCSSSVPPFFDRASFAVSKANERLLTPKKKKNVASNALVLF